MIQPERIQTLNDRDVRSGRYVLYWMQQAQRAACNHALEHAVRTADELGLPVLAVFGLTQRFPNANVRHYAFMLEGLRETAKALAERGIRLLVRLQPPVEAVTELAGNAAVVVTDRGYLRVQRRWRERVAAAVPCRMVQAETDVVVPVHLASDKEEYAARTIRAKIHEHLDRFLVPLTETTPRRDSLGLRVRGIDLDDVDALLGRLRLCRDAGRTRAFRGGTAEADRLLAEFVKDRLDYYDEKRSDPALGCVSHMSPYLHFGQVSPLAVALRVREAGAGTDAADAYLEELIVRRELSMNFCEFNSRYDEFDALPEWALKTLRRHAGDRRPYTCTERQLERGETHDAYWNAAQREMLLTGKMQPYMRMYWGKKIIEWTRDPQEAFRIALRLNNRYELDGRDPNSFAGVAWCFGKHDRPWGERAVFGTVRYMNDRGLERKFDMDAYVRRVGAIPAGGGTS
jgi:deoxyribodipyrimidine photo-lyase